MSVDAYLGDRAARVELASGQKAIVESLLPLRSPDASGALEPIDLTVRDAGDAFAPVHAASKVRLPKRLRGGDVELGDSGVRIDIPAPASDTPGSSEDGGVFYANAEAATDVAVIPEMTGVEVSYLLRSADAPERFVLGYGGGVVLREAKEGGVDVLRDEKLVAHVTPPKAWDADGQPVPMRLQADGDQLVVEVDHRDGDFAYPIVADPYTGEDFAYYDGRTVWWDQTGWDRVSTAGNGNPRRFFEDQQCTDTGGRFCFGHWPGWIYGTGLYTWMRSGYTPGFNNAYNYGDIGEWIFQAPGQSYIYRFDMWQLHNEYDSSCSYQGLFSPRSNSWEEQSYWDPWGGAHTPARRGGDYPPRLSCGTSNTDWLAVCAGAWECRNGEADTTRHIREGGNYAVFGTQIPNTRVPSFTNFMGAANISIGDRDNPQINTLTGPTGWTNDPTAKINASASDPGLGVRQLKLYAPDQPDWNGTRDTTPACNGDRNSRCSTSRAHTVDVGDLREGRNRILAEATDPVDRQSPPREIDVNVDTVGPQLTFSGDAFDGRVDPANGLDGRTILDPADLVVSATDGDPNGGPLARRSGAERIELEIDGIKQDTPIAAQACASDSCGLGGTFTVDPVEFGDGVHELRVTAIDRAGNRQVSSVKVRVGVTAASVPKVSSDDQGDAPTDYNDPDSPAMTEPAEDATAQPRAASPAASPSPLDVRSAFGLGEPGIAPFTNEPRFDSLKLGYARYIVPWNIMKRDSATLGGAARPSYQCATDDKPRQTPADDFTLPAFQRWYDAVKSYNAAHPTDPLKMVIAFEHDRSDAFLCYLPTAAEYLDATAAFRSRFPDITIFSSWNEPNNRTQPTSRGFNPTDAPISPNSIPYVNGARAAGNYWRLLNNACAACTVLAGEFLDTEEFSAKRTRANGYVFTKGSYFRDYLSGMGTVPSDTTWSWHGYSAMYSGEQCAVVQTGEKSKRNGRYFFNKGGRRCPSGGLERRARSTLRLRAYAASIPGAAAKIWLTEQGGQTGLHARDDIRYDGPTGGGTSQEDDPVLEARAGADLDFLFAKLDRVSSRIERVFTYRWLPDEPLDKIRRENKGFDSGLLDINGTTRPAYTAFSDALSGKP